MKRFLAILSIVLLLMFIAYIIQNAEAVPLNFLFWSAEVPKALLMAICAAVGFVLGLVLFSFPNKTQPSDSFKKDTSERSTD
jgi:uncharacterized integral membrane protein